MQNRYAGDVGDFGKFGLLRSLAKTGMRIGVNWYLVPDEKHNNDGRHTGYLHKEKDFSICDIDLFKALKDVIDTDNRNVLTLEEKSLLPNAVYYHEVLSQLFGVQESRIKWHLDAMMELSECQLIFADPDNGLLSKSISSKSKKSIKYVYDNELADYYRAGKSVVFYNHRSRIKEDSYLERFRGLQSGSQFKGAQWFGVKFVRGSIRDYFFILQPDDALRVTACIEDMLDGSWSKHFMKLAI